VTRSPFEPPKEPNTEPDSESNLSRERPIPEERPEERAVGSSRPLTFDEVVALFVAFLSLGSVLLWGMTRGGMALVDNSIANADAAIAPAQSSDPSSNGVANPFDFGLGREDATNTDTDNGASSAENAGATGSTRASEAPGVAAARRDLAARAAGNRASSRDASSRNVGDMVRNGVAGAAAGIAGTAATPQNAPAAGQPSEAADSAMPLSAAATATPKDSIRFDDVPDNYWAKPYIDALSSRDLISGFEDGDFKPDQFVTRAQIANIVSRTFDLTSQKESLKFSDVAGDYWARESIDEVVKGGFMSGFPNKTFNPNAPVTRAQALTTLVTGLGLKSPTNAQASLSRYTDATKIPTWATDKVAAATAGNLVVNYPNLQQLNPEQPTTRAELSAMIYQSLANEGVVEPIDSEYVVKP
jgi:hypothetical protein